MTTVESFEYALKVMILWIRRYRSGEISQAEFFKWIDEMEQGIEEREIN